MEEFTGAVPELLDVLRERPLPHAAPYAIRALLLLRDDLILDLVVGRLGHNVLLRQVVLPLVRAPVDDLLRVRSEMVANRAATTIATSLDIGVLLVTGW